MKRAMGCLAVFCLGIFSQPPVRAGAPETVSFSAFEPSEIVLSRKAGDIAFLGMLQDAQLWEAAKKYQKMAAGGIFSVRVKGYRFDLNNDGKPEIFISFSCGNKACGILVYDSVTFACIGDFEGSRVKIFPAAPGRGYARICLNNRGEDGGGCWVFSKNEYILEK